MLAWPQKRRTLMCCRAGYLMILHEAVGSRSGNRLCIILWVNFKTSKDEAKKAERLKQLNVQNLPPKLFAKMQLWQSSVWMSRCRCFNFVEDANSEGTIRPSCHSSGGSSRSSMPAHSLYVATCKKAYKDSRNLHMKIMSLNTIAVSAWGFVVRRMVLPSGMTLRSDLLLSFGEVASLLDIENYTLMTAMQSILSNGS